MSHYRVVYQRPHVDPQTQMEYLGEYVILRDGEVIAIGEDRDAACDWLYELADAVQDTVTWEDNS